MASKDPPGWTAIFDQAMEAMVDGGYVKRQIVEDGTTAYSPTWLGLMCAIKVLIDTHCPEEYGDNASPEEVLAAVWRILAFDVLEMDLEEDWERFFGDSDEF